MALQDLKAALRGLNTETPDWVIESARQAFTPVGAVLDGWEATARTFVKANVEGGSGYLHAYDGWLKANINPLAAKLPLMNPFHVVLICIAYFLTVITLRQIMRVLPSAKNSSLFKLVKVVHNSFLVALSAYMCFEVVRQALLNNFGVWLNPVDNSKAGWPLAKVLWIFYVSKIVEFNDTILMLLGHNFRQVSFLHVYHHLTIFPIWWLVTFMAPGGDSYWSAALNSYVHVIMYGYYLCTTLSLPFPFKYLITKFQMLQFFSNFWQAVVDLYFGINGYPMLLCWILLFYMISLLALFYNFLVTSQRQARRDRAAAAAKKGGKPVEARKTK
jgi:elongation of very long chain fatty acids protein 4